MYIYREVREGLWQVGYYDPAGNFHTESDHTVREDAAKRVHYLNGGEV